MRSLSTLKYDGGKETILQLTREGYASSNTSFRITDYKDGNTKMKLEKSRSFTSSLELRVTTSFRITDYKDGNTKVKLEKSRSFTSSVELRVTESIAPTSNAEGL
ncbi:hypothetical protein GOBAR_AA39672 [Gossypium barbadense]|uniref:Uncharacterized protein n=1 Tax=Gossypium barbadense TaxID=3634 RepID=A0A2P5R0I4_GOSBA|nr:hypothetical protein GOBAR_DD22760 [Gossypium barbadense]PPR81036.1 hypothetical protein GOBAR_AA39672 [Gossypium barbadense]